MQLLAGLQELMPQLRSYNSSQLAKKVGKEKLADLTAELFHLIDMGVAGKPLTFIQRSALTSQMLKCLGQHIESMNLPVTINTVVSHFTLLYHAVNLCYPGYIESGLLLYTVMQRRIAS